MIQNNRAGLFALGVFFFALPCLASGGGDGHYDFKLLVFQIINFTIFFGGLFYLLRNHIFGFFSNRLKTIKNDLAMAEKSREEAKRRLDEIEAKMAKMDEEVEQINQQARAEAEREKDRILAHAREDSEKVLEQARAEIENKSREAVSRIRTELADLAMERAGAVIRETITDKERQKLFAEFTGKVGAKS